MIKKTFIILGLLCVTTNVFSQLRNSISFSGGFVENKSYGFLTNYNYNSNNSNYEIGLNYSIFNQEINELNIKFNTTTLQLGYLHTIVRSRDNSISINFGAGVIGGYQDIPDKEGVVIRSKSGFIGGLYGAAQIDFYTSDNFAFILRGQQNYFIKTETGKTNPYLGFGLKFNF